MILFKDNIFKGTNVILKNIPKKTVMLRGYMKPLLSCDGSNFMRKLASFAKNLLYHL